MESIPQQLERVKSFRAKLALKRKVRLGLELDPKEQEQVQQQEKEFEKQHEKLRRQQNVNAMDYKRYQKMNPQLTPSTTTTPATAATAAASVSQLMSKTAQLLELLEQQRQERLEKDRESSMTLRQRVQNQLSNALLSKRPSKSFPLVKPDSTQEQLQRVVAFRTKLAEKRKARLDKNKVRESFEKSKQPLVEEKTSVGGSKTQNTFQRRLLQRDNDSFFPSWENMLHSSKYTKTNVGPPSVKRRYDKSSRTQFHRDKHDKDMDEFRRERWESKRRRPMRDSPSKLNGWIRRKIAEQSNKTGHMLPQHLYIYDEANNQHVNHILRFENLTAEFNELMQLYRINLTLPDNFKSNEGHQSRDMARFTVQHLTQSTLDMINTYYFEDFQLLGYEMITTSTYQTQRDRKSVV